MDYSRALQQVQRLNHRNEEKRREIERQRKNSKR